MRLSGGMDVLPRKRVLQAQALYFWALLKRFRITFLMLVVLVVGGGSLLHVLLLRAGKPVGLGRSIVAAYFLLFAQPIIDIPDNGPVELLAVLIPPLGISTVAGGLLRFAYLFFAKTRNDKEWFAVLAQTLKDHVIVCGAGRVGFRVFEQLHKLSVPMVLIEKDESKPFIAQIRDVGVPVLIDDVRAMGTLERANLKHARSIVCATDDDLANLNVALDARKIRPGIRVVMRLFDDDLVEKTRTSFDAQAFSTSALAAPALAMAALDPNIKNSFEVGGRLMVIAELAVRGGLMAGKTVAQLRDELGVLIIHVARREGETFFDPVGACRVEEGDQVTLQATLRTYEGLREKLLAA
ncbi:MAG TPA: NAD(P)-binding protein [Myxococcales bacterium]|jgi:voltage-gated potassium channel|nr:NAD(P)-binding protein [Myxococcales bacterium]